MFTPLHNTAPGIQGGSSRRASEHAKNNAKFRPAPNTGTTLPQKTGNSGAALPSRTTAENPASLHDVVIRYSVHEESGKTVIKIVDKESNEVVREIPSEEDLERSERVRIFVGRLFDETV